MKRILIIGSCGAGKSTFAKRLHKETGLRLIHLDRFYHKPNWGKPTDEEFAHDFLDAQDIDFIESFDFFESGWIKNTKPKFDTDLKKVNGLTVNKVHGNHKSIEKIKSKYPADVESMEGAGFLYACRIMDVHAHQFRAISNYVEPRNKDNWQIEKAIDSLNANLIRLLTNTVV